MNTDRPEPKCFDRIWANARALLYQTASLRRVLIVAWHILGICLTYYLAFLLRFDGDIPVTYRPAFGQTLWLLIVICIPIFAIAHLYSGIWAYFSIYDVIRIMAALTISLGIFAAAVYVRLGSSFLDYPRSVIILTFLLMGLWMAGGRLTIRRLREYHSGKRGSGRKEGTRALVVGNLSEVDQLIRGLSPQGPNVSRFVGIVTDETNKQHLTVRGVRVKGSVDEIGAIAKQANARDVLILPPYTRPAQMSRIVTSCEDAGIGCNFRMVPSVLDLAAGKIELSAIKRVEIEDLLGRPEIRFDKQSIMEMISNRNIMITGAGGSIGSELVRQVAHYSPAKLVLLDNSEYNLYKIDMALKSRFADLTVISIAGDVGHRELLGGVLRDHDVKVLIHAAAYKHVPLMEVNVGACIMNNTIGTARLALAAEDAGVERFLMVSTDKAVRPTSVMGATKRLAERIILERPKSRTSFVTVRFGNVLGSSGSVIPLFKKQIEKGGPITVTTEKATRFFMSIPEAVDLMLQAATIGKDREIMVLEMGRSVRIVDMARRLIELSGLKVGEDIDIVFTGLRPGEKEYEEIMTDDENVVRTSTEKIWVMQSNGNHTAPPVDVDYLTELVATQDERRLRRELLRLIPEADPGIGRMTEGGGGVLAE